MFLYPLLETNKILKLDITSKNDPALRLLGLFGAFWGKVWALVAKVWDLIMGVQELWGWC